MKATNSDLWREVFCLLRSGGSLARIQARQVFDEIMSGQASEAAVAGLLGALSVKAETVEELVGAAEAMRERCTRIACDAECMDTCGTGGDGLSTFNVSTTAAIIAAAAGATVAKHGNRSTTRKSGSTEVLAVLGVDVEANPETVERSLRDVRIGYLNARRLHPAMKFAAVARQAIPGRTIFNLLGPLTNPAGARRQLVGVPAEPLMVTMGEALLRLGAVHAWVVHGADGLCDLTITAKSTVVEIKDGKLHRFNVSPEEVGLKRGTLEELLVDSPESSASAIEEIFQGRKGARRDHSLLNAGAALVVAGRAADLKMGVAMAAESVDSGAAADTLSRWRRMSRAAYMDRSGRAS